MFKESVAESLSKILGMKLSDILSLLEIPPDGKMGDYSLPCFSLASKFKKSPADLASYLAEELHKNLPKEISDIKVLNGYLNLFLKTDYVAGIVIPAILKEKESFGSNNTGKGKKVMVEFSSPNTNKPLHIGHLRNETIGTCIANLMKFSGYDVIKADLLSDRGVHITKTMLAYQLGDKKEPDKKSDHFIGDLYVAFAKLAEQNPALEEQALEVLRKWEKKDPDTIALWKKLNDYALQGIQETDKLFGTSFDVVFKESEFYDKAQPLLDEGIKKGVFYEKDGALVAKLEPEMPDKVVLRKDGTSIYITCDLALTPHKFSKFRIEESIWITGSEQITYFKQLFSIFSKLGAGFAKHCRHVAHGLVLLPEGRMKSREGKVIDADDFIHDMKTLAGKEIAQRWKLSEQETGQRALAVSLAAIKYYFLKVEPIKDVLFLPENAISFDGDTGPYIQYSYARCASILAKAGISKSSSPKKAGKTDALSPTLSSDNLHEHEAALIKKLAEFPEAVKRSLQQYKTEILSVYSFRLAKAFSDFYESCPVIQTEESIKTRRILLVQATKQVLFSCMSLMGITAIEQM